MPNTTNTTSTMSRHSILDTPRLISDEARKMLADAGVTHVYADPYQLQIRDSQEAADAWDGFHFMVYRPAPIDPSRWGQAILLDRPDGPYLGPFILSNLDEAAVQLASTTSDEAPQEIGAEAFDLETTEYQA